MRLMRTSTSLNQKPVHTSKTHHVHIFAIILISKFDQTPKLANIITYLADVFRKRRYIRTTVAQSLLNLVLFCRRDIFMHQKARHSFTLNINYSIRPYFKPNSVTKKRSIHASKVWLAALVYVSNFEHFTSFKKRCSIFSRSLVRSFVLSPPLSIPPLSLRIKKDKCSVLLDDSHQAGYNSMQCIRLTGRLQSVSTCQFQLKVTKSQRP